MVLYGIVAVTALWFLLSNFAHANPATLAKLLKAIGGIVGLGIAGLLAIRGRIEMALLIGSFGAWLLGWSRLTSPVSVAACSGLPAAPRGSARG